MLLRTFHANDLEALIDLTVRAFEPIQGGIRHQLGNELFARQNGQWRQDYRDTLAELTGPGKEHRFLVADLDGAPAGYAAWSTHPGPAGPQGEITLLAVDPSHQRIGLGRALIDAACEAMRTAGCVVAWAGTGGDEAHTAARAAYATAGFTALPTVFYSRVL
ncbi:GNAT family N-acetyltransferase [Kocuria sabuli]|uniref:GNAT family N-acetyltransferase n=1 Tax=Kocuria sabuli TaxID=3071448 RepID=UPI0034D536AF